MVSNYIKKTTRGSWVEEQLVSAVEAVLVKIIFIRKAGRTYLQHTRTNFRMKVSRKN